MSSYIFYGSKREFQNKIPEKHRTLTDLVMELDVSKMLVQIEGQEHKEKSVEKVKVENFVAGSQEYAGVREHVILNFANFLAKMDVKNIYLHNPPLQISEQIKRLYPDTKVEMQEYKAVTEEIVIGQSSVKTQLLKALLPLTLDDREKPVIMLFYGSSGIGKTETANFISTCLTEKIFRKQFSMFQNNQFSTYLFGGAHYEKSFAKDLLDRESNVILLDEFDKAHPTFHSAFYQLFDEGIFEDQNYIVQLKKSVIICTSNYKDEDQIRKELGDAIFNRFDVVIGFNELSEEAKLKIAEMSILEVQMKYKEEKGIEMTEQYLNNLKSVAVKCRNAREIHHLVSDTFALYYIKQICGGGC